MKEQRLCRFEFRVSSFELDIMTARQKLDYRVKPSGLCLMLNHFFFVPNQTIGSIHARRLTSHEAELTKME